jgi:hypothetical protein
MKNTGRTRKINILGTLLTLKKLKMKAINRWTRTLSLMKLRRKFRMLLINCKCCNVNI